MGHRPVNPWRNQCLPWKAGACKAPFLQSRPDALNCAAASHSSLKSCCPVLEMQSEPLLSAGKGSPACAMLRFCRAEVAELGCCPGMSLPLAQLHFPFPRQDPALLCAALPAPGSIRSLWRAKALLCSAVLV